MCFEVIIGYDHQVLDVSSVHFGTQNDQHIVRTDETVSLIRTGWYKIFMWEYFDEFGNEQVDYGIYLICNGGYLRMPQLVCPFKYEAVSSKKGYFSYHTESVCKMWSVCLVFSRSGGRFIIMEFASVI